MSCVKKKWLIDSEKRTEVCVFLELLWKQAPLDGFIFNFVMMLMEYDLTKTMMCDVIDC